MLSSKQILDVVKQEPGPGLHGRVTALKRFGLGRNAQGYPAGPESHRRFVADLEAQTPSASASATLPLKYLHPQDGVQANGGAAGRAAAEARFGNEAGRSPAATEVLPPADLAWINRLPTDPTQVSYDDAVHLAALAAAAVTLKDRSAARLVQSVWAPVKELYDAAAAEVTLRNAQLPTPPVPSSVLPALADAIAAENPTLEPDEAVGRAGAQLRDALDQRNTARESKVLDARAAIAKASEAKARRTSTTKVIYDQSRTANPGGWTGS